MTPGWERATRHYATELAAALQVDASVGIDELLAMVRVLVAERRLSALQEAEAAAAPREWLTIAQAARVAAVAPSTVVGWERRGLPVHRYRAHQPRIDRAELEQWLAFDSPRLAVAS